MEFVKRCFGCLFPELRGISTSIECRYCHLDIEPELKCPYCGKDDHIKQLGNTPSQWHQKRMFTYPEEQHGESVPIPEAQPQNPEGQRQEHVPNPAPQLRNPDDQHGKSVPVLESRFTEQVMLTITHVIAPPRRKRNSHCAIIWSKLKHRLRSRFIPGL